MGHKTFALVASNQSPRYLFMRVQKTGRLLEEVMTLKIQGRSL